MTPKTSRQVNEENVERMLESYFRATRPAVDEEGKARVAHAVAHACRAERVAGGVREGSAKTSVRPFAALSFVASQARFMGPRPWALQLAIAGLVALAYALGEPTLATGSLICLAGAAIAACGIPDVVSSRACGMIELERSCRHSAREVATARCVVLAFSNALALACVTLTAAGALPSGAVGTILHAIAPYLITVGGCLLAARKTTGTTAALTAAAWAAIVTFGSYELAVRLPGVFEQTAAWLWALTALAAALWCAGQLRAWLREAATSPNVLAPASSPFN